MLKKRDVNRYTSGIDQVISPNLRCSPDCFQYNQCGGGVTGGHIEIRKYSYSQRTR